MFPCLSNERVGFQSCLIPHWAVNVSGIIMTRHFKRRRFAAVPSPYQGIRPFFVLAHLTSVLCSEGENANNAQWAPDAKDPFQSNFFTGLVTNIRSKSACRWPATADIHRIISALGSRYDYIENNNNNNGKKFLGRKKNMMKRRSREESRSVGPTAHLDPLPRGGRCWAKSSPFVGAASDVSRAARQALFGPYRNGNIRMG